MSDTRTPVKSLGEILTECMDETPMRDEWSLDDLEWLDAVCRRFLPRFRACGECAGSGMVWTIKVGDWHPCLACNGLGLVARKGDGE